VRLILVVPSLVAPKGMPEISFQRI